MLVIRKAANDRASAEIGLTVPCSRSGASISLFRKPPRFSNVMTKSTSGVP